MPTRPTLRQLQYFMSAVQHRSFAAAAAAEHISQPSLSQQIATLEKALGVRLFIRTTRGLLLTDAGRLLIPQAETALQAIDDLTEKMRGERLLEEGTVSFGTFNSAHLYLLTDLIRDFHAQYPNVTIRVVGLNSAEVAELIRAGELEAGIVQLPVSAHGLKIGRSVFSDEVVFVSKDRQRAQQPVTIERLAAYPMILSESRWAMDDPLRLSLLERAQRAGVSLKPRVEVEFQTHALELTANGVGDTLVSYHVGRSIIEERGLYWAPLDPPVREHYAFVLRKNAPISPATAEFITMAHKILERLRA